MPKQKKDARAVNLYLSTESIRLLEKYCEIIGLSKTVAVERMIKSFVSNWDDKKNNI